MNRTQLSRTGLGVLLAFGAFNAFGGSYYGLAGAKGVPRQWLRGSPFPDYFIPSLVLGCVVGGSLLLAAIAVFRRWQLARLLALAAGAIVLGWIGVQVALIGYVSWMQPATAIGGGLILALAWRLSRPVQQDRVDQDDGTLAIPARRLTSLVLALAVTAAVAAAVPLLVTGGPGPGHHTSVRGQVVTLYGYGPYRHMPADVAVQGLAQDVITLTVAVPFLLFALAWARRGARAGHLALCGAVAYLLIQYALYLAMGTYNQLFLLWVLIVQLAFLGLVRLLLAVPAARFEETATPRYARRAVGLFLIVNGALIALLWLSVIVPPLLDGTLYPAGLAHFTTMVVQGFDLALFLPPSILAGYWYLRRRSPGALLAGMYVVFLCLQMLALLAKILWMDVVGASAGPALVIIPVLLVGAVIAATLTLRSSDSRYRPSPAGAGVGPGLAAVSDSPGQPGAGVVTAF
jgi:hypothetical protein